MAFASLTIDLNARLANIERDMGKAAQIAERESHKIESAFKNTAAAAAGLTAALGVGLSLAGFATMAKQSIDAADNLKDLSARTDASVRDLASLELAAEQSGTEIEAVGKAMNKMSIYIANNAEAAKKLGLNSRDPVENFTRMAEVLSKIDGPATRNATAMAVFGKSYEDVMPLLREGPEYIRASAAASADYAAVMAKLAPKADAFNDQLAEMRKNASLASALMAGPLVDSLNNSFEWFKKAAAEGETFKGVLLALGSLELAPFMDSSIKGRLQSEIDSGLAEIRTQKELIKEMQGHKDSGTGWLYYADDRIAAAKERIAVAKKGLDAAIKSMQDLQRVEAQAMAAGAKPRKTGSENPLGGEKGSKADPLAGLFGQTETGILAEYNKNLALVDARYRANKIGADQYSEALLILNERLDKALGRGNALQLDKAFKDMIAAQNASFDLAMEVNDANIAQDEKQAAALGALRGQYVDMIDPMEQYRRQLDEIQKLQDAGLLNVAQALAAGMIVNDAMQKQLEGLKDANLQTSDFVAEAWKSASRNIETSLADFLFDPFQDGLDGMLLGFVDTLRKMAAEALSAQIMSNLFGPKGSDGTYNILGTLAGFFGFAEGGVMTPHGPLALQAYAGGGIASSPQLALFGEGRQPEAFVPLPDGRSIPVKMAGQTQAAQPMQVTTSLVLVDDRNDVPNWATSPTGERVYLSFITRNRNTIRSALGL